jgi:uncharacterized protein YuzE
MRARGHRLPHHPLREVREPSAVRVNYDASTDTLLLTFRPDDEVAESDESRPGIVLDYAADGSLIALEILDASQRVTEADRVDFAVAR